MLEFGVGWKMEAHYKCEPQGKRKDQALALIRKKLVASRSVVSAFTSEQRRRSVAFCGEEEQSALCDYVVQTSYPHYVRLTRPSFAGAKLAVAPRDRKIPLGFARRDFVRKLQAAEKKLRPCPYPKKVGSDSGSVARACRDVVHTSQVSRCSTYSAELHMRATRREIRSDRTFQVLSFLIKNGRPVRWTDLPFLVQVTGLEPA